VTTESPDWAFGPDLNIKCPTCKKASIGFNWIQGNGDDEPPTGMTVLPCTDLLTSPPWRLDVSGRGNITYVRSE
jgi:hypothetical protein